jgi:type VI secretion system protein VasD
MTPPLFLFLALVLALSGCTTLGKVGQVLMDPSVPVGAPGDQPTQVAFSLYASPTLNGNPRSHDATAAKQVLEPNPYAVSLSAGDPHALTEKVKALLEHLQSEFPAMSPLAKEPQVALARSPMEESSPGSYDDPTVQFDFQDLQPVPAEQLATPVAIKVLQLRDDSLMLNSAYPLLDEDPAKALRSTYIRDDDYLLLPGQFKFVRFEPLEADTRFIAVIANYHDRPDATWKQVLRIEPRGRQIALSVQVNDSQILLKEES